MPSSPQTIPTVVLFNYEKDDANNALVGARVSVVLNSTNPPISIAPPVGLSSAQQFTTTDANGYWQFSLIPNTNIAPANTTYTVNAPSGTYDVTLGAAGPYQSTAFGTIVAVPVPLQPAVTGPVAITGNLTVTGNETVAGPLVAGSAGGVFMDASGNIAARSFTALASSPYAKPAGARAGGAYFTGDPWYDVRAYGALGDGTTDDTAAINAAILACLGGSDPGGTVYFPVGNYACATPLTVTASKGRLRLLGSVMDNQSNPALLQGSAIVYTGAVGAGATTFLNVVNHSAFTIENLSIQYTNAAFVGSLVAIPGCEPTRFERVSFTSSPLTLASALYLMDMSGAPAVVTFNDCFFQGSQYCVIGNNVAGSNTANVVTFNNTVFNGATIANIRNPGQAWTFNGCTHEPLVNGKGGAVVIDAGAMAPQGVTFNGGWAGDTTDATVWTWFPIRGKGWTFRGFYLKGNTNATGISVIGTTSGLEISAMSIFNCLVGVNVGSGLASGVSITGNDWGTAPDTATGTPISGSMVNGIIHDPVNGLLIKPTHTVITPTANAGEVLQVTDVNGLTFADFSSDSGNRRLDLVNLLAGFNIYSDSFSTLQFAVSASGDVTYRRHLLSTASGAPAASTLGANVTSVTFTGNDRRGTIAIVMSGALAANTKIATCTYAVSYGATAPFVFLPNQTSGVGLANVNFYRLAVSTGVSFDLACNQALAAGTYTVGYIIEG